MSHVIVVRMMIRHYIYGVINPVKSSCMPMCFQPEIFVAYVTTDV